jgi:predicted DsbA family dithiol-disulfide isomerase
VRIEKLKAAYEIETKLVHFPLHPDTPLEGRSMAEHYAQRGIDPEDAYQRMKTLMDAEGLPYGKRTHSYNSRLAQELGKWADTVPDGDKLHDALYRAYFVDARNIGDVEVLIDVVETAGLDPVAAREIIETRRFKDAVDADWAKSAQYGVTGVPTFVAERRGVVGAQPYEVLEQLMGAVGAVKRG